MDRKHEVKNVNISRMSLKQVYFQISNGEKKLITIFEATKQALLNYVFVSFENQLGVAYIPGRSYTAAFHIHVDYHDTK